MLITSKQEGKQALPGVTGLSHSSLIHENMYTGQRFKAFPWYPVGLEHVYERAHATNLIWQAHGHTVHHTGMFVGFMCDMLPPLYKTDQYLKLQWNTENKGQPW